MSALKEVIDGAIASYFTDKHGVDLLDEDDLRRELTERIAGAVESMPISESQRWAAPVEATD